MYSGFTYQKRTEKARGSFFGINLGTTKADLAESILEGICFEMKDIMAMNQELSGEVTHVRLCGGVAKSPMWCQMFADILERPVELTKVSELGALGAAMCAGIGAGLYKDCEDAVKMCVKITEIYKPDNNKKNDYNDAFKVWEKYYRIANESIYV